MATAASLRHLFGLMVVGAAFVVACTLGGCDQPRDRRVAPSARADGVTAKRDPAGASARPTPTASASATRARPHAPRKLCQGQEAREPPAEIAEMRHARGAGKLPPLHYGQGRWVWINLWAGWCKPCKVEMPMLLEWREKLRAGGAKLELAFVSVDEDEREMMRFLSSQPPKGVRASYWVEGEDEQEKLFASLGFDDTPQLPIHAFVSPQGKVACIVKGALERSDYPALARLLGQEK